MRSSWHHYYHNHSQIFSFFRPIIGRHSYSLYWGHFFQILFINGVVDSYSYSDLIGHLYDFNNGFQRGGQNDSVHIWYQNHLLSIMQMIPQGQEDHFVNSPPLINQPEIYRWSRNDLRPMDQLSDKAFSKTDAQNLGWVSDCSDSQGRCKINQFEREEKIWQSSKSKHHKKIEADFGDGFFASLSDL